MALLATLLMVLPGCHRQAESTVTLYPARKVITMNPAQPTAQAVAVSGGWILAVGALVELQAQLTGRDIRVDSRFDDKVLMPGFIDPHIHPTIAATILPMHIVAAMSWPTSTGASQPVRKPADYFARLRELDDSLPPGDWLTTWGYHAPYHGPMSRSLLDKVSLERPIMVWQRSVHEMFFNTRALDELGLGQEDFHGVEHADWETGHLWETGLFTLGRPMMARIASPGNYLQGLSLMSELVHQGGVTTVGEQGFPQTNSLLEYWSLRWELRDQPYRSVLVPNAMFFHNQGKSVPEIVDAASNLLEKSSDKVRVARHVKYYADGAIYSQLMQMTEPYLDGHHGEWMMPPSTQAQVLQAFWQADWDIHIHVNGDAGLDGVLDDIEHMRAHSTGQQPRIVLEHYGYARKDQHARVKTLGVKVSNNPYYLYELAPVYAHYGLGPERARDISPLRGLLDAGVPVSFHSDFTMAPLQPLTLAWVAVNRQASDGQQWGAHQAVPLETALAAITIEAAKSLGMEREIGSIIPGKRADFTVLESDPYEVPPLALKDIPIWGTVFEGKPYPLDGP